MENVSKNGMYRPEALIGEADAEFAKWLKDGRYRELLTAMQNLGEYSLRNQMLILKQSPGATNVNGMNMWNYKKRNIRQGEKSLKILAPVFAKEVSMDADGNMTEKTLDKVTGYKVNFVFDISQTEGETLKDIRCTQAMLEENFDIVSEALKGTVKGFDFVVSDDMDGQVSSVLDTDSRSITVSSRLDKESMLRTLINQLAAAAVITRDRRNFQGLRGNQYDMDAVETSAVNYVVSNRLGLHTEKLREPDFKKLSDSDIDKLAGNIGVVRSVSQKMIIAVESRLSYELNRQRETAKEEQAAPAEPGITDVKLEKSSVRRTAAKQKTKTEAVMG